MSYNPFTIANKKILVLGGSSGIGRSVAIECSKMNASVVILGRDETKLREVLNEMNEGSHSFIVCDLLNQDEFITKILYLDSFDAVVCAVGIGLTLPFRFTKKDVLERVMDTNFMAPVLSVHSLLKHKKINNSSSVVYLSSIDGALTGHVGNSIYSASKAALIGMARSQAVELASKGIRVNCVSPARVDTPFLSRSSITNEQVEENKKLYPMKRYATPEEIAYYILYLISDASTFTTGSNLVIDGGFTLQ
ncbi:MAG: SDR family oxidoreductase [bacterium]